MKVTEDMLAAHADRELDVEQSQAVYAAAAQDKALAQRLLAQESLGPRVQAAYRDVLEEPIPAALLAAVENSGARPRPVARISAFAAMAACLLVGVVAGRTTLQPPLTTPDMMAQGRLAAALDDGLASAPEGAVRLGVSFRQADGGYCRSFQTRASQGLACRSDGGWRVEALAASEATSGPFRTAASMSAAVAAAIDARIAGEPLDASAERAARDAGWRPASP